MPDALLRSGTREGQVVVRFLVSELGKVDVASMVVERSDDDLFTEAVRDVLPLFLPRARPHSRLGIEAGCRVGERALSVHDEEEIRAAY